jgi:hypothetical protein
MLKKGNSMKMKFARIVAALGVLAVAGVAFAATQPTAYFLPINLDFTPEGTRVYEAGAVSVNPNGCPVTDAYEPSNGLSPEQRESMDKALAGAFLAGRKVRLLIFTNACGPNNRPAYSLVRLDHKDGA